MKIIEYIIENKEWIFSGIGVAILAFILSYVYKTFIKKETVNKSKTKSSSIKLQNSKSNTVQLINSQNNYSNKRKIEKKKEAKESLKEIYKLIDLSIKSIEIGLAPDKFNPTLTNEEYLDDAINKFLSFSNFFSSNDFLYNKNINTTIQKIKELLSKCINKQKIIEEHKRMNFPNEIIIKESFEMENIFNDIINIKIPIQRELLKTQINKYLFK